MARAHSTRWLVDQVRVGLRDLPTNTAWLASRVHPGEVTGSAVARTRDKARRFRASVVESASVGDSVETQVKRAREAAERAQEAEDEALEAAQKSKETSAHVRQLAEQNRAWLAGVERDANRRAEERVAEARRAAEEQVERERAAAQKDAEEELEKARAEAAQQTEAARREAEAVQQRADELLAKSRERLEEARRLAAEAEHAALAVAAEAHRQAQQLAEGTEQPAKSREENGRAAEQAHGDANAGAMGARQGNGKLESHSKAELQELAASLDIEGHTKMNKAELIAAITKATPTAR